MVPPAVTQKSGHLSKQQEAYWFVNRFAPGSSSCHASFCIRITASLDLGALDAALKLLAQRHSNLSSAFHVGEDDIVGQTVLEASEVDFAQMDISALTETQLQEHLQEAKQAIFDLTQGKPFRARLFSRSPNEHLLLFVAHVLVVDSQSLQVILHELPKLYQACVKGQKASLPDTTAAQGKDFAAVEQTLEDSPQGKESLDYWLGQLANPVPVLDLPLDCPRAKLRAYQGASHAFAIDAAFNQRLQQTARRIKVPAADIMLAAWQILLHRYSQKSRINTGILIDSRWKAGCTGLVGCFSDHLVLTSEFDPASTADKFLHQISAARQHNEQHQHGTFATLVKSLGNKDDLAISPIFQSLFVWQQALAPKYPILDPPQWQLSETNQYEGLFDLVLDVTKANNYVGCALRYNSSLFNQATIGRMAGHFLALLEGLLNAPKWAVGQLPLLTAAERQKFLLDLNKNKTAIEQKSINHWFVQQVQETPDALALVFSDGDPANNISLSYRELNEQANQLAHYLTAQGVVEETLIGLSVQRSLHTIIGILGIIKAGAAYIPLDPAYPTDRLSYMLENSQMAYLLTDAASVDTLPSFAGATIVLERQQDAIKQHSRQDPELRSRPGGLACVIYTSGSTGKPKGVMLEHRNLCNTVIRAKAQFGVQPGTRVALFASFSFVMSVGDIFSTLCSGATLFTGSRETMLPGDSLTRFLHNNAIEVVCMAASSAALLVPEQLPKLKHVLVAGEPCAPDVMRRWVKGRNFIIGYGMTEMTGGATTKRCTESDQKPLLGGPNPNTNLYILDEQRQPVPVGVVGELYLGGAGLSRGYLHNPALTAERYMDNPFTDEPDAWLYRSGDLARYLPNGEVEFQGRADFQINIRGFRVEPGEVESVLNRHPKVARSIVAAKPDPAGNTRLVGYFQPQTEAMPSAGELRDYLAGQLPEYMLPANFVPLKKLPLTPNGKLDRLSLPELTQAMLAKPRTAYSRANTQTEKTVVEVFQQVLGIEQAGIDDNFFELGADSLLLIKVCDRLQQIFHLELPVIKLFEFPTIRLLAQHLGALPTAEPVQEDAPQQPAQSATSQPQTASLSDAYVIVLSARDQDRLKHYADKLCTFVQKTQDATRPIELASVAFTLQVGRKPMQERLAFVAANLQELVDKLGHFASSNKPLAGLFSANLKQVTAENDALLAEWDDAAYQAKLMGERDLDRLAALWVAGAAIDWQALYPTATPRRIALPTYPFARQRHTLEAELAATLPATTVQASVGSAQQVQQTHEIQQTGIDQLYFNSVWEPIALDAALDPLSLQGTLLLFAEDEKLLDALRLSAPHISVVLVQPGDAFHSHADNHYSIQPTAAEDYQRLMDSLLQSGKQPTHIIHFWSQQAFNLASVEQLEAQLAQGFYAMFHLGKTLIQQPAKALGKIKIIYVYRGDTAARQPAYAALYGFANSLRLEDNRLLCKIIGIDAATADKQLAGLLAQELVSTDRHLRIRYINSQRQVKQLDEFTPERQSIDKLPLKQKGVYIITGGLGGLGLVFAEFLAREYQARLVLTGRSALSADKQAYLRQLETSGAEVVYMAQDVAQADDVAALVAATKGRFGGINGIVHSAGVIRRKFIREAQVADLQAVLAPKLAGTLQLDSCLQHEPLDFFVLFSSISAEIEGLGLPGYAFSNAFLDHFAEYREQLRADGQRFGKTLAINWPLWKYGGMQPGKQTEKILAQTLGMTLLQTDSGVDAFAQGLGFKQSSFMLVEGYAEKIRQALLGENSAYRFTPKLAEATQAQAAVPDTGQSGQDKQALLQAVHGALVAMAAKLLKKSPDTIELDETLYAYGFDSLSLTEFAGELNEQYALPRPITPSIFFEHATLAALAGYLLETFPAELAKKHGVSQAMPTAVSSSQAVAAMPRQNDGIASTLQHDLIAMAAKLLKRPASDFDLEETLYSYGFDSLSLTEFAGELNEQYGLSDPITPSVFFEHSSIGALAGHLQTSFSLEMQAYYAPSQAQPAVVMPQPQLDQAQTAQHPTAQAAQNPPVGAAEPVAIIGIDGMLPQSENLEEFWQHLVDGDNLVTEIPPERWDWKAYYGDPDTEANKTDVIWGGFLKQVEAFDPLFFSISPREAELMDPQQRLFLQASWKCIEDSGYKASALAGSKTGVFVGITNSGYRDLIARHETAIDSYAATGTAPSMIPNRVSYLLNLHGPSEPIDTACSSSLVAVHRAVRSIQQGECEMAIAGGVNVILSPLNYIYLSRAGVLSKSGRCSAFDQQSDGFVRSEGVAALLLKPLSQALQDNDHVYAVIRSTAMNHGGHANSVTTPNTSAQADLLVDAYSKAGIDPTSVSYIEAHGTGTKLGDPTEINALKKGFATLYQQWNKPMAVTPSCGVGSVKSNAGHMEAAAGMGGILKTVLSLKHQTLPGNLHFHTMNSYIDLQDSPFYIVDKTQPWLPLKDAAGNVLPRRAGISSFGFGGTNAHVVLEEFSVADAVHTKPNTGSNADAAAEYIFVLSAKNQERLRDYARDLADYLYKNGQPKPAQTTASTEDLHEDLLRIAADILQVAPTDLGLDGALTDYGFDVVSLSAFANRLAAQYTISLGVESLLLNPSMRELAADLQQAHKPALLNYYPGLDGRQDIKKPLVDAINPADLAYTLQVGREAMPERLAIVSTLATLADKLSQFSQGAVSLVDTYAGRANANRDLAGLLQDQAGGQLLEEMVRLQALRKAANLWVVGIDIDWQKFYVGAKRHRIPLPTYPFGRDHYWVANSATDAFLGNAVAPEPTASGSGQALQQTAALPAEAVGSNDLLSYLTQLVAAKLKVDAAKLDPDVHFETYGLDSLVIGQLHAQLKQHFADVSPTLFFTHKSIRELQAYFNQQHAQEVAAFEQSSGQSGSAQSGQQTASAEADSPNDLLNYLTQLVAAKLKVDAAKLDPDVHFETYGLDSLVIGQLNAQLRQHFTDVSPTLFFTHKSIRELQAYFNQQHPQEVAAFEQSSRQSSEQPGSAQATILSQPCNAALTDKQAASQPLPITPSATAENPAQALEDIAIIGMSGSFPLADDIDTFWENLKAGRDCVTEIPKARWDYRQYPGIYCKWGGFLDDFDKFDPQLFNISPNRARFMTPQERVFLQASWSCIEDAGYTREKLADPLAGDQRGNVGVFAGVSYNEYQLNTLEEWAKGNFVPVNTQICSVANRVSYFMNLRGPSLSVDTACSASLNAVHLACESIRKGECGMAIAGGVNLSQHPAKYVTLCSIGMLSRKGRCNAFGEGGDGMVPAEAVGALLLKPLRQAEQDGDRIYALIKGTAVNHDGKTYGYTVPNPVAQTEVIEAAMAKSGIDADTISYVEAHGTGTSLGDPIEIEGLSNAYRKQTQRTQYCAVGSAKSNIGHAEAAAGVVQLIKVILQMQHQTLVPSVLDDPECLNPNIEFARTPFYVQQQLAEWKQPVLERNGRSEAVPRRAGITSLGASGVNVHLVMEEYTKGIDTQPAPTEDDLAQACIVPLAAMQPERLQAYAAKIKHWLDKPHGHNLADIAYTLQIGRESMPCRAALVANTLAELARNLGAFAANLASLPAAGVFYTQQVDAALVGGQVPMPAVHEPHKIAEHWVNGGNFAWESLYQTGHQPRLISLPGYPFAKERYWVTDSTAPGVDLARVDAAAKPLDSAVTETLPVTTGRNAPAVGQVANGQAAASSGVSDFLLELADAPESEQLAMVAGVLQKEVAAVLGHGADYQPPLDEGFFAMGIESIQVMSLQAEIEQIFQVEISDTAVFDYPDIRTLSEHVCDLIPFDDLLVAGETQNPLGPAVVQPNADLAGEAEQQAAEELSGAELALLIDGPLPTSIGQMPIEQVKACLEAEIEEMHL